MESDVERGSCRVANMTCPGEWSEPIPNVGRYASSLSQPGTRRDAVNTSLRTVPFFVQRRGAIPHRIRTQHRPFVLMVTVSPRRSQTPVWKELP